MLYKETCSPFSINGGAQFFVNSSKWTLTRMEDPPADPEPELGNQSYNK
jgi:hypothetical protein